MYWNISRDLRSDNIFFLAFMRSRFANCYDIMTGENENEREKVR